MTTRIILVTPAQVDAAKAVVEWSETMQRPVPDAVRRIASARTGPPDDKLTEAIRRGEREFKEALASGRVRSLSETAESVRKAGRARHEESRSHGRARGVTATREQREAVQARQLVDSLVDIYLITLARQQPYSAAADSTDDEGVMAADPVEDDEPITAEDSGRDRRR